MQAWEQGRSAEWLRRIVVVIPAEQSRAGASRVTVSLCAAVSEGCVNMAFAQRDWGQVPLPQSTNHP